MIFADPATVAGAIVARLTTEAAGSGVRALLADGADGVISADALEPGSVRVAELPARPFIALALGPVASDGARDLHGAGLWLYDDLSQGHARLGALGKAAADALDVRRGAPPLARGDAVPGDLSEPRIDSALGLRARRLALIVYA